MELNIAPVDASAPPLQNRLATSKPVKGSWKKRRKVQVIQRARQEKQVKTLKEKRRERDEKLQSDEFQSGIKAEEPEQAEEPKPQAIEMGPAHPAKRRKTKSKLSGANSLRGKPGGLSESALPVTAAEKPRSRNTALVQADQTPEAVSATLAVIGTEGKSRPKSQEKEADNPEAPNGADDLKEGAEDQGKSQKDEAEECTSFSDTGLYRSVSYHVSNRLNLAAPTPVQQQVLKHLLGLEDTGKQSADLLVRSPTGSGKTLSYLLPIAHYLLNRSRRVTREEGSMAIVMVPTRELAEQVQEVALRLFRPWHWIVVGSVTGGENKRSEKARLRKGVTILVATPGRLLDHMRNTQSFMYGSCEFFVLDEADRLLDLGFEAEVKEIVNNLNNQAARANRGRFRSNILLSATLRKDVEKLAEFSLEDPIEITASPVDESGSKFAMPSELRQHFCIVEQRYRLVTLACFLRLRALKDVSAGSVRAGDENGLPTCKVIVFFSTCDSVDFHHDLLKATMLPSELSRRKSSVKEREEQMIPLKIFRIHGNHSQAERVESLRGFRNSSRAVLLCTDVAARGLDLKGLTFAIQYDPPTGGQGEELEYLHRAGRTARMGARGDALLFLLPSERAYVGKLESKGVSIAEISGSAALAALYPHADLSRSSSISYATRLVTSAVQEAFELVLKSDEQLRNAAVAGFQAYCRAYATHAKDVRHFFHVRNLHLGHVARAFVLSDKPAEFGEMMSEIKKAKAEEEGEKSSKKSSKVMQTTDKGEIARAIAEGEQQPFNAQSSTLARRRREKGRGHESFKEIAMEFGA